MLENENALLLFRGNFFDSGQRKIVIFYWFNKIGNCEMIKWVKANS